MRRGSRPGRTSTLAAQIVVLLICVVTGILFGWSAKLSRAQPTTLDLNLPHLVAERQASIGEAESANQEIQQQIDALLAASDDYNLIERNRPFLAEAVQGPGVQVTLDDAAPDVSVDGSISPNDLVVHQEDVNAVMNALWKGGAEAMAVQGVRITPRTPVRCIGNVILVGSTMFSPPYKIEAIGSPDRLVNAVNNDPQIQIYQQYVRAYGLGWRLDNAETLHLPALTEGLSFKTAQVIED
ncbi:DUF881 domain-containing protein [Scrofimicrobium sp. R131]|uniref:DUF881 domain-containing protein n=1 Tax=Scrofimicrobium appendicitidis TaxID=3079930 RepID=A0AAU7V7V2_9ACTO